MRVTMSSLLLVRWRLRGYNPQPSVRTFFHVRIIAFRIPAEIPVTGFLLLRLRLDIHFILRRFGHKRRRIVRIIRIVGIIIGVAPPPRTPPPIPTTTMPTTTMPTTTMPTTTMPSTTMPTANKGTADPTATMPTANSPTAGGISGKGIPQDQCHDRKGYTNGLFHVRPL
ncbi:MAG: hypothetical protein ABSA06_15130 [Geobacteraceae bacterium]